MEKNMKIRFCVQKAMNALLGTVFIAAKQSLKSQLLELDFDDCESIQQICSKFDDNSDRSVLDLIEFKELIKYYN